MKAINNTVVMFRTANTYLGSSGGIAPMTKYMLEVGTAEPLKIDKGMYL